MANIECEIVKNERGRYEIVSDRIMFELRCGDAFEVCVLGQWLGTNMEYSDACGYYAVGLRELNLEGYYARVQTRW